MLTWIVTDSPGLTLVRDTNPSIHGDRYLDLGSTRTLVAIQSRVPGWSFSARIRSGSDTGGATRAESGRAARAGESVPAAAALRISRRVRSCWLNMDCVLAIGRSSRHAPRDDPPSRGA